MLPDHDCHRLAAVRQPRRHTDAHCYVAVVSLDVTQREHAASSSAVLGLDSLADVVRRGDSRCCW